MKTAAFFVVLATAALYLLFQSAPGAAAVTMIILTSVLSLAGIAATAVAISWFGPIDPEEFEDNDLP